MKLTVLGSGVSTLIPNTAFRYPSAHLIEVADHKILFDAGIGVLPQLAKLDIPLTDIDTICISHYHADHFAIEPILQAYYLYAKKDDTRPALHILGPSDIEEHVRLAVRNTGWTFDEDIAKTLQITFTAYPDGKKIKLSDSLTLQPFRTQHYALEAYALRLTAGNVTMAYSGDSATCEALGQACNDADLFLCEAAIPVGMDSDAGHMSCEQAGELAQKHGCKQLVLTHYYGYDSSARMIQAVQTNGYQQKTSIAADLDVFEA